MDKFERIMIILIIASMLIVNCLQQYQIQQTQMHLALLTKDVETWQNKIRVIGGKFCIPNDVVLKPNKEQN